MQLRTWWKAWGELVLKFLALAGSLASLVGLLVPFLPSLTQLPWWTIVLLVSAMFFFCVLVVLEFLTHRVAVSMPRATQTVSRNTCMTGSSTAAASLSGPAI
jgi:type III secretory pathway component EscS